MSNDYTTQPSRTPTRNQDGPTLHFVAWCIGATIAAALTIYAGITFYSQTAYPRMISSVSSTDAPPLHPRAARMPPPPADAR